MRWLLMQSRSVQSSPTISAFGARMCESKATSIIDESKIFKQSCRCSRLNLISLAYLWRRDQAELLQEMIDCQLDAILIKVSSGAIDLDDFFLI